MSQEQNRVQELIDALIERGILKDRRLIWALQEVPLRDFLPNELVGDDRLFNDEPLPFYQKGWYVRTISAPHMICIMLQSLGLEAGDNLLILGAKSGYIAALASFMTMEGEIFILEANQEIADITRENLKKTGYDETVSVYHGSPLEGLPNLGPWQKILVTGTISEETVGKLLPQLDKNKGVLFAPVGGEEFQEYLQFMRDGEEFFARSLGGVRFGPLQLDITYKDESIGQSEIMQKLQEEHKRFFSQKVGIVRVTPDRTRVDNTVRSVSDKYDTSKEKELPAEEIEDLAVKEAFRSNGSVPLLHICELLDVDFNAVVKVLGQSSKGKIQEVGPHPLHDKVFVIPVADPEIPLKIKRHYEDLLNILQSLRFESNLNEKLERLKAITTTLDKLEDLNETFSIKLKKLRAAVQKLSATEKVLQDFDKIAQPTSDVLTKKESIYQQEVQQADEIIEIVKSELKRIESLLK